MMMVWKCLIIIATRVASNVCFFVAEYYNMIRRGSYMAGEPLIVVEESGGIIEEEEEEQPSEGNNDSPSAPDSPSLNPYLLSPYRDLRKRSLPTPHCTTGIMASQVSS